MESSNEISPESDSSTFNNKTYSTLDCPVCLAPYNAVSVIPYVYPACGHGICRECSEICVKRIANTNNTSSAVLTCPTCRQINSLPVVKNFTLLEHLSMITEGLSQRRTTPQCDGRRCNTMDRVATIYCMTCSASLCNECSDGIHSFIEHPTVPVSQRPHRIDRRCDIHDEKLLYFCSTCDQCICRACCDGKHERHSTLLFEKIVARRKCQLQMETHILTGRCEALKELIPNLVLQIEEDRGEDDDVKTKNPDTIESDAIEKQITMYFEQLRHVIAAHETSMKTQYKTLSSTTRQSLQESLTSIGSFLSLSYAATESVNKLIDCDDNNEFVKLISPVSLALSEAMRLPTTIVKVSPVAAILDGSLFDNLVQSCRIQGGDVLPVLEQILSVDQSHSTILNPFTSYALQQMLAREIPIFKSYLNDGIPLSLNHVFSVNLSSKNQGEALDSFINAVTGLNHCFILFKASNGISFGMFYTASVGSNETVASTSVLEKSFLFNFAHKTPSTFIPASALQYQHSSFEFHVDGKTVPAFKMGTTDFVWCPSLGNVEVISKADTYHKVSAAGIVDSMSLLGDIPITYHDLCRLEVYQLRCVNSRFQLKKLQSTLGITMLDYYPNALQILGDMFSEKNGFLHNPIQMELELHSSRTVYMEGAVQQDLNGLSNVVIIIESQCKTVFGAYIKEPLSFDGSYTTSSTPSFTFGSSNATRVPFKSFPPSTSVFGSAGALVFPTTQPHVSDTFLFRLSGIGEFSEPLMLSSVGKKNVPSHNINCGLNLNENLVICNSSSYCRASNGSGYSKASLRFHGGKRKDMVCNGNFSIAKWEVWKMKVPGLEPAPIPAPVPASIQPVWGRGERQNI